MSIEKLANELKHLIPEDRIYSDSLQTFAYGTDASFYRLTPKLVVKVKSEDEIIYLLKKCQHEKIPITFRASGTSLSGQSITDSVLVVADRSWNQVKISEDGSKITLDPAALGGRANIELAKFHKKIGPDPASINAATVAGIASNNASGMTSGVKNNSYNTVIDLRVVFANGEILNTGDQKSREKFIERNRKLIIELLSIANDINKNNRIVDRIYKKYKIKNTTGYSINSFVDFQDPIEIIKHLLIGSEGTLGFISQITLKTVPQFPHRATALVIFPDVNTACSAIPILQKSKVDAAEIMDRASLRSVENKKGLPNYLKALDENAAALLIETSARNNDYLNQNIAEIKNALGPIRTVFPIEFTSNPLEFTKLWNVRKGLFPSVSKSRQAGKTIIIEDVNFHTSALADAVTDLQELFKKYDYNEAIIWGHALSGNIHFVFAQDFNDKYEVDRYRKFLDEVVILVIQKYDGSLKAEHGTGRNMAPFVKFEWGKEIYGYMQRVKKAFDPNNILNPGVLINDDKEIYVKNLKRTPVVNPIIDKCIDCGFCENSCPSKNLTLTPRQRISVWREIHNTDKSIKGKKKSNALRKQYKYFGEETCAVDGLCELSCPVDIDTGKLIKQLRSDQNSKLSRTFSTLIASNFGLTISIVKMILRLSSGMRALVGENIYSRIADSVRNITFSKIPKWNKYLPKASRSKFKVKSSDENNDRVIYFPSCISRSMGTYANSRYNDDQATVMHRLFSKAGFDVIYPNNLNNLCCGMPFSSKGFDKQALNKQEELEKELIKVSENGTIPIVFDTSPCTKTFSKYLKQSEKHDIKIYDSTEFIADVILVKVSINEKKEKITVHSTCSTTKMELSDKLLQIANACAEEVIIPKDIHCCGFAGDRGFNFPELNKSALEGLDYTLTSKDCKEGYSTSRTCEIGLSLHSGVEYNSIAYLVDECTQSEN